MAKPISAIILTAALIGLTVRPISFALQTVGIEFPVSALKYESQAISILEGHYGMEAYFSHDGSRIIYQGREGDRSIYPYLGLGIRPGQSAKGGDGEGANKLPAHADPHTEYRDHGRPPAYLW